MARRRYQARVCENDACQDVGKATASFDKAVKRMRKAVEKMRKRSFGKRADTDQPFRAVHGEVVEHERGKPVEGPPVYASGYGEGSPRVPRPRRPRRSSAADES